MKYYLCGPIDTAGQKEKNIENFKESAAYLRAFAGLTIISPIEIVPDENAKDYMYYIKKDIHELLGCDAIILPPGIV